MKTKFIIFDLDDTLLDTTRLLIPIAKTPAFEEAIRRPLPLMPGALENLKTLSKNYSLGLLTFGRTEAQQEKVKSLNIGHFFRFQYFADPRKSETKGEYFKKALTDFGCSPQEGLSIGNRKSTDLREAKILGYRTCWFSYGEHLDEPETHPFDQPDVTITKHSDLIKECGL